jgi:hypothetical protein
MRCMSTIGKYNSYRRRRLSKQYNINYNSEYERLVGELTQTNLPYAVRHSIQQRNNVIKKAIQDSQIAKDIV